jgi:hypothetical protein
MFHDLTRIFNMKELSVIAGRFIENVQYSENLKYLNLEKLLLIHKLVCSDLFLYDGTLLHPTTLLSHKYLESRDQLLKIIVRQLQVHMHGVTEELQQCTRILSVILDSLQSKLKLDSAPAVYELLPLLPQLIHALNAPNGNTTSRQELIICLLTIVHLTPTNSFQQFIDATDDKQVTPVTLIIYHLTDT